MLPFHQKPRGIGTFWSLTLRRRKLLMVALVSCILFFIIFQIVSVIELNTVLTDSSQVVNQKKDPNEPSVALLRQQKVTTSTRSHPRKQTRVKVQGDNNAFRCLLSGEEMPSEQFNDDICDCEDMTDEPGTAACPETRFVCKEIGPGYPSTVPSNRVNDGVADCCDSSDEWLNLRPLLGLSESQLKSIRETSAKVFLIPSVNRCRKE